MRRRVRLAGIIVGVVALAIVIVGLALDVRRVAAVFVVAYATVLSVCLGAMAMIMIAHLTTAMWFASFRRAAETITGAIPVLALLGGVVCLSLGVLYPWVGNAPHAGAYLNVPFFIIRWLVYAAFWIGIDLALRAARRVERSGDLAAAEHRFKTASAVGLVLLGFTMTFAAFDWLMSLTPTWSSTIYGVYWFAGAMVAAIALLAVLTGATPRHVAPIPPTKDVQSLGKLQVTFVLFWTYIGFAQYIVVWSGNLPSEVSWYVPRTQGAWGGLAAVLLFGQFVFPFLLLIAEPIKRNRAALAVVGGALLVVHYLDMFWVVLPHLVPVTWWTVVVAVAVLALVTAIAVAAAMHRRASEDRARAGAAPRVAMPRVV